MENTISYPVSIEHEEDHDSGHSVVVVKDSKGKVIISENGTVNHDLLEQLIKKANQ
jgi:hypothetical protein